MRFFVARMFNLYGPGETNAHVIPDILNEIARGPILRLGNIDAIRDYLYVDDAKERQRVREAARDLMEERYAARPVVDRMVAIYDEVAQR